jgi:REP element-mobilizing transposase RayT
METENYCFFMTKLEKYILEIADILAYCLMPNHYHLLIQLREPDLSSAMHKLALSYVVPVNKQYQRSGHLFQGRFQLKIVEDTRYLVHLSRYIHLNPLSANLVDNALDWDYSSLKVYLGLQVRSYINYQVILDHLDDFQGSPLAKQQANYKKFIEDWDPDYMSFKAR